MGRTVKCVNTSNVAASVDHKRFGAGGAGKIDRAVLASAQQKPMVRLVGVHIISHDVAAIVDPEGVGKGCAGESIEV